jgi:hypothetical protein
MSTQFESHIRVDTSSITDGTLWAEFTQAVAEMEKLVYCDPRIDDDIVRAEGLRYLTRIIAGGIPLTMELMDPYFPQLFKLLSPILQHGTPGADCIYHIASVKGGETYRIYGKRGTCQILDVETRENHPAHLGEWDLIDHSNEFQFDENGEFEIILSSEEHPGNWIRLPHGQGTMIIREYYYDWLTEVPSDLVIERVGAHYPPEPLSDRSVTQGMQLLIDWIRQTPVAYRQVIERFYSAPDGVLSFSPLGMGWSDLRYAEGHYRCEPDEAIIVELEPPVAPYWGIQLCTHFWESLDWNLRQTSINGHQAILDDDSKFRAVIAHTDPGVPNWLDTAGRPKGLIVARYFKAKSHVEPTMRKVPLASVRDALPSSTKSMTPEERQKSLRARALSFRRRDYDT